MHRDLYRVISVTILVAIAVVLAVRRDGAPDRCSDVPGQRDPVPDRFEGFQPVTIERASREALTSSGMEMQQHLVIRNAATWTAVWQQIRGYGETTAAPVVDFARQVVIVAALGAKPTGGYSINITDVRMGQGDAV